MNQVIVGANILLLSSISLLFTLWITNSLKASICTTKMLIAVIIVGILHKFGFLFLGFAVLIITLSTLTWRAVLQNKKDRWIK